MNTVSLTRLTDDHFGKSSAEVQTNDELLLSIALGDIRELCLFGK
jgi:hypothetical protein